MRSYIISILCSLGCSLGAMTACATVVLHELPPEVQPLAELAPQSKPAQKPQQSKKTTPKHRSHWATVWVDQADNTYQVGEYVQFFIKAKRDVYITLLNVGTSGRIRILYPNAQQPDHFMRAGQIVAIPGPQAQFAIQAQPPAGTELVKLIATQRPHAFFDPLKPAQQQHFRTLAQSPTSVAATLKALLKKRHGRRWSSYAKVLHIVADGHSTR